MRKNNTKLTGNLAEDLALNYLTKMGLKLRERNYQCYQGEVDLIMEDKNMIIFVEVRMRNNLNYGNASMSVTAHKQKKIIHTAQHYLWQKSIFDKVNCRFDIIGISYNTIGKTIEWLKNAFTVPF